MSVQVTREMGEQTRERELRAAHHGLRVQLVHLHRRRPGRHQPAAHGRQRAHHPPALHRPHRPDVHHQGLRARRRRRHRQRLPSGRLPLHLRQLPRPPALRRLPRAGDLPRHRPRPHDLLVGVGLGGRQVARRRRRDRRARAGAGTVHRLSRAGGPAQHVGRVATPPWPASSATRRRASPPQPRPRRGAGRRGAAVGVSAASTRGASRERVARAGSLPADERRGAGGARLGGRPPRRPACLHHLARRRRPAHLRHALRAQPGDLPQPAPAAGDRARQGRPGGQGLRREGGRRPAARGAAHPRPHRAHRRALRRRARGAGPARRRAAHAADRRAALPRLRQPRAQALRPPRRRAAARAAGADDDHRRPHRRPGRHDAGRSLAVLDGPVLQVRALLRLPSGLSAVRLRALHRRQDRPAVDRDRLAPARQPGLEHGAGAAPGRPLRGLRRVRALLPRGHPPEPAEPQDAAGDGTSASTTSSATTPSRRRPSATTAQTTPRSSSSERRAHRQQKRRRP